MQQIMEGAKKFCSGITPDQRELFIQLANEQHPKALFIVCSDSRIVPHLVTQTGPGDLFLIRNAGNLVPSYQLHPGGEAATIEYAVHILHVQHIVVCGHTQCAVMKALLREQPDPDMPAFNIWITQAYETRQAVRRRFPSLSGDALYTEAAKENVMIQLEHLKAHPSISPLLQREEISLHGWLYRIETGEVEVYDPGHMDFSPLNDFHLQEVSYS